MLGFINRVDKDNLASVKRFEMNSTPLCYLIITKFQDFHDKIISKKLRNVIQ